MVESGLNLLVEMDALSDAVNDLRRLFKALRSRHGERYRALDRRIQAIADDSDGCADIKYIGDGRIIAFASGELAAILRDARKMGLI